MLFLLLHSLLSYAGPCHYSYTVWNAEKKVSLGPYSVSKDKKELKTNEKGPWDCSICDEDQENIQIKNGLKFKVCRNVANKIKSALNEILSTGYEIKTIVGYRASMSKGSMDKFGLRTEFSSHAFGVSLDINENFNGLYENCLTWNTDCQLRKGGRYDRAHPLSLKKGDSVTRIMQQNGFLWGGVILGKQKDFMHFSPTGY